MNGIDLLSLAAICAGFFWNIVSIMVQQKWKLYNIFLGKKYAFWVHAVLISIIWLQVAAATAFIVKSDWGIKVFWPLGSVLLATSIWCLGQAVRDLGVKGLYSAHIFGKRIRPASHEYQRHRNRLYAGFVGMYASLGLTFGRYGYFAVALFLAVGCSVQAYMETPVKNSVKR